MQTIKLDTDGPDQMVRLPAEFRFESEEVAIRKDPQTGDVILSPRDETLDRFFAMVATLTQEERDEFVMPPRDRSPMRMPDFTE